MRRNYLGKEKGLKCFQKRYTHKGLGLLRREGCRGNRKPSDIGAA